MTTCFTATPGVDVITTTAGLSSAARINASSVIDPVELRWIWLTHADFDHIGSQAALLDANPYLRVITSFLGVGIIGRADVPLSSLV